MSVRGVVVSMVALGLLGVGVYASDQHLRQQTEQTIAHGVSAVFDEISGEPTVTVHGWPFVTQLVRGTLGHATGTAEQVRFGHVTAQDVVVDARGITLGTPVVMDQVVVSATITAETAETYLRERSGLSSLEISVDGDQVTATVMVLDRPLSVTGRLVVDGDALRANLDGLSLAGLSVGRDVLPAEVSDGLDRLRIPVTGLPRGMSLVDAQAVPGGVRFTATGTDVPLVRPG